MKKTILLILIPLLLSLLPLFIYSQFQQIVHMETISGILEPTNPLRFFNENKTEEYVQPISFIFPTPFDNQMKQLNRTIVVINEGVLDANLGFKFINPTPKDLFDHVRIHHNYYAQLTSSKEMKITFTVEYYHSVNVSTPFSFDLLISVGWD